MPDDNKLPPPSGDTQRAEGYVSQLLPLISESKLRVVHTDLSKFDPSSLHDHYSLDLNDYQIEISHSKQPTTGRDSYVILFNNLKNIAEDKTQKEILAYLIISEEQFKKLKDVADEQIETLKKIEEEKRFKIAMTDVDKLLGKIAKGEVDLSQPPPPLPAIPPPEEQKTETPSIPPQDVEDTSELPTKLPTTVLEPVNIDPPAYATPDTRFEPEESVQKPLSPLEAAAAIPLVEETPNPETTIAATEPSATTSTPEPAPVDTAQTASIEEVQKALHQAYQQAPPAQYPKEFRPNTASVPIENPGPFEQTINTSPTENNPNTTHGGPQLDQEIDQAFKPADNNLLTHVTQTPEV